MVKKKKERKKRARQATRGQIERSLDEIEDRLFDEYYSRIYRSLIWDSMEMKNRYDKETVDLFLPWREDPVKLFLWADKGNVCFTVCNGEGTDGEIGYRVFCATQDKTRLFPTKEDKADPYHQIFRYVSKRTEVVSMGDLLLDKYFSDRE